MHNISIVPGLQINVFKYNLSIAVLPVKSRIRVVSKARDWDSPKINNLPPNILERVGADPPCLAKWYIAFVLNVSTSADRTPIFWDIEAPIKIGNLDATLPYVCETILFSVQNHRVFFLKYNLFSLFSILPIPLIFHYVLLWVYCYGS